MRDRRPPLNETAHVADSQRSSDSLFKNKRSRTIAKGDGFGFIWSRRGKQPSLVSGLVRLCAVAENAAVRNPIDIDSKHSRAIVREIGEELRASLKEVRELPTNFRMQLERLRRSEDETREDKIKRRYVTTK